MFATCKAKKKVYYLPYMEIVRIEHLEQLSIILPFSTLLQTEGPTWLSQNSIVCVCVCVCGRWGGASFSSIAGLKSCTYSSA